MKKRLLNIWYLGLKELQSLWQDKVMLFLIIYSFSLGIYIGATSASSELNKVPIAFVDEDRSPLSARLMKAFHEPEFLPPAVIDADEIDKNMDEGIYTFVITIPPSFEKELLQGKHPTVQVNIDATRMSQAGIGAGYIQQMINDELNIFLNGYKTSASLPINLVTRIKFNPTLDSLWFGSVMKLIEQISMLSIILSGAALIREREHGTLEHLLVMPLSATEIMLSKVWSMGLVVVMSSALSLFLLIKGILAVPIIGSEWLFLFGALLMLFATTSMGIFMGTVARTMPQLGLIVILTILPLQVLSGSVTPFDSMPEGIQDVMLLMPTSHFVSMAQAVLYRGAGIDVVWPELLAIVAIGMLFFLISLAIFRKSLASE
ncbi:ABC transporter permease [Sulfurimonas marina]|uniref:ABC transporter permease n=1 Tax=Sulfurimonas marina TaxID=2590551 RepID=A0A7M1AWY4_9BACT|nr:ABC transporter permease [Sulfurimonas marina]QOP41836.1 ABC transporter permease [Sulfurimonas marina]